jgi:hypothetical protein
MSKPLNPTACQNLARSNPDRVIRRTWNTSYEPRREDAMNPENYGLSLDEVSPLGYAVYDYGTLRQSAYMTEAWFVITTA